MITRIGGLNAKVSEEIANRLLSTNPQALRSIVGELRNIEAAQIARQQKAILIEGMLGRLAGQQGGTLVAN